MTEAIAGGSYCDQRVFAIFLILILILMLLADR